MTEERQMRDEFPKSQKIFLNVKFEGFFSEARPQNYRANLYT